MLNKCLEKYVLFTLILLQYSIWSLQKTYQMYLIYQTIYYIIYLILKHLLGYIIIILICE